MSQVGGLPPAGVPQRSERQCMQVRAPGWGKLLLHRVPDQRVNEPVGARTPALWAYQMRVHRRIKSGHRAGRADTQGSGQGRVLEVAAQD